MLAALATASPAQSCPAAKDLFRDLRAHAGSAWGSAKELIAQGKVTVSGLSGTTTIATNLVDGSTSTTDEGSIGRQQTVVTPRATWKQDFTLGVHPLDSPDARAAAVTATYLARRDYLNPSGRAAFGCPDSVAENGRTLERLQIVPRGGRPVTVWIDRAVHAVVRTQQQAPTTLETEDFSDFRDVQGLLLPFTLTSTDGRPEDTAIRSIQTYRISGRVNASDFARPPDPANQKMIGGATFSQVAADMSSGSPVVEAYVNGQGPLAFILDTGGHAILTADAAKQLGIAGQGNGASGGAGEGTISLQFGRVNSLRIGDAELTDFTVLIIPYDKSFSDRGPGKPPLAGILGLEIFERFAVTIDYAHGTLRLDTPSSFAPSGAGTALPILFQEDEPLTYASADGVRGLFGIDTGNSGRTVLFGDFLRANGFFRRYSAGLPTQSLGTGGVVTSSLHRLRALSFGGLTMHDFLTNFVVQQTGSFSSRTEAGNIGHDVLAQFTVTFDYARERLYLRPGPPLLQQFTRAGFAALTRDSANHIVVQSTIPDSPAADAGLQKGDVILSINGTPTENISADQSRALVRQPAGTALQLRVQSSAGLRDVTLILRDLLCNAGETTCAPYVSAG